MGMDVEKCMTQAGAAREIGIDAASLSRMIDAGRVESVRTADGLRLVPLDEVARLKSSRPSRGRPKTQEAA